MGVERAEGSSRALGISATWAKPPSADDVNAAPLPVFLTSNTCMDVTSYAHSLLHDNGLFLLFAPLSPSLVVLLYDRDVYKVGSTRSDLTAS